MEAKAEERPFQLVLVLGSAPHSRLVTAYTWENLPSGLNVADYQIVVLNFASLESEIAGNVTKVGLPPWDQFARLLFSDRGEVVAIGMSGKRTGDYSNAWWLPAIPQIVVTSGQEIKDVHPEFGFYFEYVKRWSFHTTPGTTPPGPDIAQYIQTVYPEASVHDVTIAPLAQTRFDRPIAFTLQLRTLKDGKAIESGKAIWLPATTEISHQEAVNLILRQRYGIGFEQTPPDWLKEYKLPGQIPIEAQIASYHDEIHRLTDGLKEAQHRLQHESRFQKLLFEQGEDGLESAVRDALRDLGAKVDDPQQRGREDGRLIDPSGRNGMLEIKGRTGTLRLSDVRQLRQWVDDAIAYDNWNGKGILIGNMFCDTRPNQRDQPFPDNCIRLAQQYGLCLITTTQLFLAVCSHQRGEFDIAAFWNTVFGTDGVCPLPELT